MEAKVKEKESILTVMTYNVAHGRGRRFHQALVDRATMERTLAGIAGHILEQRPHVVALQEIDQSSVWNHRVDQLSYLKELTGYDHARHGIHADKRLLDKPLLKYGVGILSRLEPISFYSEPFKLGRLDTKGFTCKRFQFRGHCFMLIALHLDFRRHRRRVVQARHIIEHVQANRGAHEHLIVMGDFNCTPKRPSSPLRMLMGELDLHTVDPTEYRSEKHASFTQFGGFRLDYVLVDRTLRFADYRTGNARLSDHEYVVARLALDTDAPDKRHGCRHQQEISS